MSRSELDHSDLLLFQDTKMNLTCHFKTIKCLPLADSHQADIKGLHALIQPSPRNRILPFWAYNNRPALCRIKSMHTG